MSPSAVVARVTPMMLTMCIGLCFGCGGISREDSDLIDVTSRSLRCVGHVIDEHVADTLLDVTSLEEIQKVIATGNPKYRSCSDSSIRMILSGRDPWGTELLFLKKSALQQAPTLRSAGPDRIFERDQSGNYCDPLTHDSNCGDDIIIIILYTDAVVDPAEPG